ncbi:MAG: hypothetical protein CME88_11665 [Hirschia sp.]|nr:hypothetical protein [Hirschia sp.]MBF19027.1 hypothetical protein [Hirschia sp.]|tara:strand:- start:213 stop:737 length:525 start_codon:yes stop_codon:yes gene_type:complete
MSLLSLALRFALAGIAAISLAFTAHAQSADDRDNQIRAAMVFNFVRYAEWHTLKPTNSLVLCVSEDARILDELRALSNREVNGKTLTVHLLSGVSEEDCHLAYLSETHALDEKAFSLFQRGVLTISSVPDFTSHGMIELVTIGRQTRFSINNSIANEAGVSFSSRLLRLAVTVR